MKLTPKDEKRLMEELRHIVGHYPMWPGDTLMGTTACELERLRLVGRDKNGNFIPKAKGLAAIERGTIEEAT